MNEIEGVVLTGVYGAGKSSVVAELTERLEQHNMAYGAIDVDWLWWFDVPGISDEQSRHVLCANLKAVIANYLNAGVDRFLFAWSIRDQDDLEVLKRAIPFPFKVIALTTPLKLIKERLAPDVTAGRQQDIRNTEQWLQEGIDPITYDVEVVNDRPIRETADEILDLLKWTPGNAYYNRD